ncbi:probable cytochrome P450 6a14 [Wyeomyia smithii]|uniref:probable cytochrome P450 6a14 n=1 Tax=Wyeomyia smithii TaxID=174621 RepID=UPI00246803DB|nr:probable cytochrome P450 6a14 [Wyeomyia smithii]
MLLLHILLVGFFGLAIALYRYIRNRHRFFADRDFPCAPNPDFLFGHVKGMFTSRHACYINQELYQSFKGKGERFGGFSFFTINSVMVVEPELIKSILVKDFNVFHDRGIYCNPKADPLSGHLFLLEGPQWRSLRQKLSPTFTSGRMKGMFGTILGVADEFNRFLQDSYKQQPEMEMKEILARFTTDVIGSCAFGLDCNTLKNPNSDFLKHGKRVFEQSVLDVAKFVFCSVFKSAALAVGLKLTPDSVEKFFIGLTRDTVEYREKNNIKRNDFMNLLLQIKNQGYLEDKAGETTSPDSAGMTIEELAAQCFVFFVAGFETSSTTMNFCLYELAKNPDIQERLRSEIETAIAENNGEITYDLLMGIKYLDNVVNETLRKYPPVESLNRIPLVDYKIPDSEHVIPKQTMVVIPVYAMHHDPDIYPEPERFDPDRFLPEQVQSRHPYTFIPFGEGPRICVGLRFGVMQTKIGLMTLLRHYKVSPSSRTPDKLLFDAKMFVLSPLGGNYLRIEKISAEQ